MAIQIDGRSLYPNVAGQFALGQQQNQALDNQRLAGQVQQFNLDQAKAGVLGDQQAAQQQAQNQQLAGSLIGGNFKGQERQKKIGQLFAANPDLAVTTLKQLGANDQASADEFANFAFDLQRTPFELRGPKIEQRAQMLTSQGRDPKDTISLANLNEDQQNQVAETIQLATLSVKDRMDSRGKQGQASLPAETVGFNDLIKDFTPEQQKTAKLVKAGLKGRAMSNAVLSAIQSGDVTNLAQANAEIKQAEEFAKKTGVSRARAIDDGFDSIKKIDVGMGNIDAALEALKSGAGVGAIEKFLPSIKAASVELDNIRNKMALDVIGSVTFGALSEGELNLAKETALPTGLNTPQLIDHLEKRKAAQNKLRSYYAEQIDFLDQGGTVAGFLRSKKNASNANQAPAVNTPQVNQAPVNTQPEMAAPKAVQVGRFTVEEVQ